MRLSSETEAGDENGEANAGKALLAIIKGTPHRGAGTGPSATSLCSLYYILPLSLVLLGGGLLPWLPVYPSSTFPLKGQCCFSVESTCKPLAVRGPSISSYTIRFSHIAKSSPQMH